MTNIKKHCILLVLMILVIVINSQSVLSASSDANFSTAETSPAIMTVDLVLCRPLGIVATLAGTVIFVVSSPFSGLGGNLDQSWDTLVAYPAEFTFKRPLGEFE